MEKQKLSYLINKLPEELIEKVLENLEIDELEAILTTNNNKLIRIAKPILKNKEEIENDKYMMKLMMPIEGYDISEFEMEYEEPTVDFLNSQYELLKSLGIRKRRALVTIVANILNYCYTITDECFRFLDSKNFDYNSRGYYRGDGKNEYIVASICEYRKGVEVLEKLHRRGARLDVNPHQFYNKGPKNILYLLIFGPGMESYKDDFSEMAQYLIDNGVNVPHRELLDTLNTHGLPVIDLHPNVRRVLNV